MAFSLFCCALFSFIDSGSADLQPRSNATEEMIGLKATVSGMRAPGLSFYLRENNGETLFSSSEFGLENVSVPPEYMQKLRDLANQHGFEHMKEKDTSDMPHVVDAPMYYMTMYWPGKKSLRLNYWPARDEVKKFFEDLVDACVNKPGAPEDISSLIYTYVHNNRRDYFRFELRGEDGKFQLTAHCYMSDIDKVTLRRATVDMADVQRLREIVKRHGIVDIKGNPIYQGRSAPPTPYTMLDIHWPDKRILRLNRPDSGAEELEKYFRDLVQANSELWEPIHVPELINWLTFVYKGANDAESFMFYLREVSASTQLYARCVTAKGEKIDFHERVDDKYMDQLREIVKKHGLVALARTKEQRGKKESADDPYILNMDWREDPGLSLLGRPPGADELEKFFRSLAEKYK